MKKEDLFLIIFGIAVGFHLFFNIKWWVMDGIEILPDLVWDFNFIFNQIVQNLFMVFGIIGFKNLYTSRNFHDPYVKAYVIYRLFYFIINIILFEIIFRLSEDASNLNSDIFYIISTIVNIVFTAFSIMIYGQRPQIQYRKTKVNNSRTRFYNYIIDYIFLLGVSFQYAHFYMMGSNSGFSFLIFFFIGLIYYTISEGLMRQSFGKLITKTYVYGPGGSHAPFTSILRRTACRFIPFEPFSFLDGKGEGWHDRLSSTYVFYHKEEAFEEDEDDIIKHLVD